MGAINEAVRDRAKALPPDSVAGVRAVLAPPDAELDYTHAKLELDRLIDPDQPVAETMARLDAMVEAARGMAGLAASPDKQFSALRALIYQSGPWNDHRPFAYDLTDPLGQRIAPKLLGNYLASRRGNCISMPVLFVILAERLGLDVAFARAPLHLFVRYRSESGRVFNLETTSGCHPTRDAWFREQSPISDRAIETGIYLRSLTRREGVAALANTVLEHLLEQGRYDEALGVSAVILRHAPRDTHAMVKQGTACAHLIRTELTEKYPVPGLIPPTLRGRLVALAQRNRATFAAAEALGWEAVE